MNDYTWIESIAHVVSFTKEVSMEWVLSFCGIFGTGLIAYGTLKNKVDTHINNEELHPTHKEMIDEMVPRDTCKIVHQGLTDKMETMSDDLTEVKRDIKTLLRK